VHDHGVVEITASSYFTDKPRDAVKNIADLTADSRFCSQDHPEQWACYDFRHTKVALTHYSVRSCYNGVVGGTNLKSWALKGSVDGSEWIVLDRQIDSAELDGPDLTAAFPVAQAQPVQELRRERSDVIISSADRPNIDSKSDTTIMRWSKTSRAHGDQGKM
jgi:hypothetical protein